MRRGKRDGVVRHIQSVKTGIGWEKLRYCVNDQSGIQRD